jgi:hypothetical protein
MRAKDVTLDTRVRMAIKALRFVHKKAKGDHPEDANVDTTPLNAVTGSGKSETGKGKATIAGGKNQDSMPLDFLLGLMRAPDTPVDLRIRIGLSQGRLFMRSRQLETPPSDRPPTRTGLRASSSISKRLRNDTQRMARLLRRRATHPEEFRRSVDKLRARIKQSYQSLVSRAPPFTDLNNMKRI